MPDSPTEAGELTPSPKATRAYNRMDTQEDDALNIQPPQTHIKKDKSHKHKHKKKEHRRERKNMSKPYGLFRNGANMQTALIDLTREDFIERSRERTSSKPDERERNRDRPVREDRGGERRDDRGVHRDVERKGDRAPVRDDRGRRDDRHREGGFSRSDSRGELRDPPPRDLRENLSRSNRGADSLDRPPRDDRKYSPNTSGSYRDRGRPVSPRPPTDGRDRRLRPEQDDSRVGRRGLATTDRRDDSRNRSRSPLDRTTNRDNRKQDMTSRSTADSTSQMKKSSSRSELKNSSEKKSSSDKSDAASSSKKPEVVEVSDEEAEAESEEEESGDEEESGSGEEEESSSGEEEESGSGEEESGSGEESEEEEAGSEEEEAGSVEKEAESSASASQSEQESSPEKPRKKKSKKHKKRSRKERETERQSHKSKFESESESEAESGNKENGGHRGSAPHSALHSDRSDQSDVEMAPSPEMSDPPTPPPKLPPYLPALQGCRSVDDFTHLNRIEEGTYGVVFRAEDRKQKQIVALKRLKMEKEKEGFPITSLREINTLLKVQHENIVTVREIVVGSNMDKIYVVMDFVEHDLKALMESMKNPFAIGEVKTLLLQLLKAVAHMHDNWILHRDLKTSNLLLSHKGILKVGDFGLAREYGSPLKPYTPVVVTLWYRAPELLLGCKQYSTPIDMWSVGAIFAEMLLMKPLWPGKTEIDELNKIFKDLGTPNEKIWPGVSKLPAMQKCTFTDYAYNTLKTRFPAGLLDDTGYDLLNKFLTYDPTRRWSADDAKQHDYFNAHPLPVDPSLFPTWPARSEQPRGKRQETPKPPSGGQAFKLLNEEPAGGFHLGTSAPTASTGFNLKF